VLASATAGAVERGADGVPTAFRIWMAGENVTDHGTHLFTERSARELLADQAHRENLFSIDVDHMSLNENAPPESHKAVGWHRLEVRGSDLWATDVEWTDAVRAGLAKDPPEWRYFSPAYEVDKKTQEIVGYLNTALTNNPATHAVTALASRSAAGETDMDPEKKKAALAAIAAAYGEDKDGCAAAIKAAFPEAEGEKKEEPKAEKKATEEPPKEEPKAEKKATEEPGDKTKEEAAVAATKALAAQNVELANRVAALEKDKLDGERAEILASRKDLPPELVKTLEKMPLALMKETIASLPKPTVDPAAAEKVQATRGAGQANASVVRAARLPQAENEELAARFGRVSKPEVIRWEGSSLVLPQISKVEAQRILKERGGAPPPMRPRLANLQDIVTNRTVREEGAGK